MDVDRFRHGAAPRRRYGNRAKRYVPPRYSCPICPRGGFLADVPQPTSPVALGDVQWILPNRPKAIIDLWELGCRAQGLTPPATVLQSGSFLFVKALLFEGPFVTILPRGVVHREIADGTLAAFPLQFSFGSTKEGIIYLPRTAQMPALGVLIAAIRAEYGRHLAAEGAANAPGTGVTEPDRRLLSRSRIATGRSRCPG